MCLQPKQIYTLSVQGVNSTASHNVPHGWSFCRQRTQYFPYSFNWISQCRGVTLIWSQDLACLYKQTVIHWDDCGVAVGGKWDNYWQKTIAGREAAQAFYLKDLTGFQHSETSSAPRTWRYILSDANSTTREPLRKKMPSSRLITVLKLANG